MNWLDSLNAEIVECRSCPRLVAWREQVAAEKRKSFLGDTYWGRPVPLFGDPDADRLILGLAPAAHGANRTGRMFTGDRSGDFLFEALHTEGVANQPTSVHASDGLQLRGALMIATALCAPPANKPTPEEVASCSRFLKAVLETKKFRAVLCLGGIAWNHIHRMVGERPIPFAHGRIHRLESGLVIVGCYHPSQQNTFTGRLTQDMLREAIRLWLTV